MPKIALLDGPTDNRAKSADVTWEELCSGLRTPAVTKCAPCSGHGCESKKGRAWIPARFAASPCERLDANVEAITFAVFDVDAPTVDQMSALGQALNGTAYLCHETHARGSYRLVLPLRREVPASMWPEVWRTIAARFNIPADPTCANLGHLYFTPTCPEGETRGVLEAPGDALDWEALDPVFPDGAKSAAAVFKSAIKSTTQGSFDVTDPKNTRAGPVDLDELRRAVTAMRRPESRELLDRVLSGRRLAEIGFRDAVVNQAASLLASASVGKPYPVDVVLGLLHGSIRAMDTAPEGLDHWIDLAREKYLRAAARRLERDASSDADKAAILRVLGRSDGAPADSDAWRIGLLYTLTASGDPGGLRAVGANANLIMRHDPAWKGTMRFNEITREIDIVGGPLAGKPKNSLEIEAMNWFARSEYKLFLSKFEVGDQMLLIARECAYDPLREWIESLVWDGKKRVRDFFAEHFGAEGDPLHLTAISECFLISCIARAMDPGCEVHTVPVLVGGQGVGKSRSLKALGQPYFTDSGLIIGTKDAQIAIASKWIVELAELSSVKNVDIDKIKAFVSSAADDFRPPYGRVSETFRRRCVFVGSTNEDEVLTDWTGNRRWWPLRVRPDFEIDVARVAKEREQLFAEALVMYRAGQQWHLNKEQAQRAEEQAEGFKKPSIRSEQILNWYALKAPGDRPREPTNLALLSAVLGIPSAQITSAQAMDVGRAARELGFTKHRKRQGGRIVWVYRVPDEILTMRKEETPSSVELVIQAKKGEGE